MSRRRRCRPYCSARRSRSCTTPRWTLSRSHRPRRHGHESSHRLRARFQPGDFWPRGRRRRGAAGNPPVDNGSRVDHAAACRRRMAARIHHQSGARLVLYQPQIASWLDQKRWRCSRGLVYPSRPKTPTLGTSRVEADTKIAVPERLVSFSDLQITSATSRPCPSDQLTNLVKRHQRVGAARGPRHRTRPGTGGLRHEPGQAAQCRRHQADSAAGFLQRESGRCSSTSMASRSGVPSKTTICVSRLTRIGTFRIRISQDLLPSCRQDVDDRSKCPWTVERRYKRHCRRVFRNFPMTTTGRT